MKRTLLWAVLLFFFGVWLAGCRGSQFEELPPNEIISRSAQRMAALAGFEFLIERSGAPAFLDYEETISFRRAEGQFTAPDKVYTSVRVIAPGLVTEVHIISLGGMQWETNLLTGQWQASDPRYSFNPGVMFNPQTGISAILASELTGATLLGMEELPEVPGKKLHVLEADLQGESSYNMTYGMIDNDPLRVKLWVDPVTFDLYRVILVDPADPGDEEDTIWQIDFWSFGSTFDIQEPAISQ